MLDSGGPQQGLSPDLLAELERIGQADIVVGIPSFRNADTIAHVVRAASEGMVTYFRDLKPVLVNSDGGSEDRTRDIVLQTPVPQGVDKIVTPYGGPAGKGSAFKTIFDISERLNAKVCIVVDSDLRSITPEWIRLLGDPIWRHNHGFVAPYYTRYKYDGTITNALAYPLTRALYGLDVRQPIGGDFGLCWALTKIFSHQAIWDTQYISRFGIDIWMTTTAICEGFRVCQSQMGVKLHDPKDPGADLGPMFRQVVGTMFAMMQDYEVKWKATRGSQPAEVCMGREELPAEEPARVKVKAAGLIAAFQQGFEGQRGMLQQILHEDVFREYLRLSRTLVEKRFRVEPDTWVRTVYDCAAAYNFGMSCTPEQVIDALLPLYYARTASFVRQAWKMTSDEAEELVQGLAQAFEDDKLYLVSRWDHDKREAELSGATCRLPWRE